MEGAEEGDEGGEGLSEGQCVHWSAMEKQGVVEDGEPGDSGRSI